jgi:hypothetical protein
MAGVGRNPSRTPAFNRPGPSLARLAGWAPARRLYPGSPATPRPNRAKSAWPFLAMAQDRRSLAARGSPSSSAAPTAVNGYRAVRPRPLLSLAALARLPLSLWPPSNCDGPGVADSGRGRDNTPERPTMNESKAKVSREGQPLFANRRWFSEEFKRDAVRLVVDEAYSFKAAAQAVGSGERTTVALPKGTVPFSSNENRDSPPLIHSPILNHRARFCDARGGLCCLCVLCL